MIVVDASAMVEALVGPRPVDRLLNELTGELMAPQLLDIEVLSSLRGLVIGRKLELPAADRARNILQSFTISRFDTGPFLNRIWELRNQFTCYDATYLALAEGLNAPLVTCDRKLTNGHRAIVKVFPKSPTS